MDADGSVIQVSWVTVQDVVATERKRQTSRDLVNTQGTGSTGLRLTV